MTSVVKRTISVPADVFAAVEAEVTASQSLSTLFSEGARLPLRQRAGARAVTTYEAEHGPISQAALDEADRLLDGTAGVLLAVASTVSLMPALLNARFAIPVLA